MLDQRRLPGGHNLLVIVRGPCVALRGATGRGLLVQSHGVDKGPKIRAGCVAETTVNRHDFGMSWNSLLELGGVVVRSPDW